MNPFDELSIEEAVRMREKKKPVEDILAFSAGPAKSQDVLRTAMAMGADRGLPVVEEKQELDSAQIGRFISVACLIGGGFRLARDLHLIW